MTDVMLDRRENLIGAVEALVTHELQPIRLPTARIAALRPRQLTFDERIYLRAGFRLGVTAVLAAEFLIALWWRP